MFPLAVSTQYNNTKKKQVEEKKGNAVTNLETKKNSLHQWPHQTSPSYNDNFIANKTQMQPL